MLDERPRRFGRPPAAALRRDDGIALIMALGIMLVLVITTVGMITYTTAGQDSAKLSAADVRAMQYAESGLNVAYSAINYQLNVTGGNPSKANLLGCAGVTGPSDINGPSNCASPTPLLACFTSGCALGDDRSASVYGYYSGTNSQTFLGRAVPAATWLLVSSGYARNPEGATVKKVSMATVKISPLSSGGVASVWNHIFITAPYNPAASPQTCSASFSGNGTLLTSPMYVIGNLCLTGNGVTIQEATGGQPVDLQVGGKLVLSGNGTTVGNWSSSPKVPITSGVVVGGCTTVAVTSTTTACNSTSYKYLVGTTDTFVPNDAPALTAAAKLTDWQSFDPGPKHPCAAGSNPYTRLPDTTFDNDSASNLANEPNNSGAAFELLPSTSYSCVSQSGAAVGNLSWNPTGSGSCGCGTLTVNGSIFIDGNLTLSRSATYTGTGVIEVAGTVTIQGNGTTVCATNPCAFTNWQGTSGNNSMLTLASLTTNSTSAINLAGNSQTFQGSVWTDPTSQMVFNGNSQTVEGPMSVGGLNMAVNGATLKPLPIIKNMPIGAPVPPNTSASVGPLVVTG